jgi:quercetin dioxygenase-like cupin family protein
MFWGARVKITESNIIDSHSHRMSEIVVCLSDTGTHYIDGKKYNFKYGRTFFLPELVQHQAYGTEKNLRKSHLYVLT